MTLETFRSWLEAYGRAWEARDSEAAASLYTDEATYQITPFLEPMRGRASLRDYWAHVAATEMQIQFEFEILAVQKDFSLDASGRCHKLREWWQKRETELAGPDM